jgi:hypothetical protein
MMPARQSQTRSPLHPPPLVEAVPAVEHVTHAATLSTTAGDAITAGTAHITLTADGWSARVSGLDRPGQVAAMYFAGGVRDVLVRLADGRTGRARIARTSFIAAGERICDLTGIEPLA